jgi:hypothetical protein
MICTPHKILIYVNKKRQLCMYYAQSNSAIKPSKGLNILRRYKRVLFEPSSIMLWLTVRN